MPLVDTLRQAVAFYLIVFFVSDFKLFLPHSRDWLDFLSYGTLSPVQVDEKGPCLIVIDSIAALARTQETNIGMPRRQMVGFNASFRDMMTSQCI